MQQTPLFPEDSPFILGDSRRNRWAVPYSHECLNARTENLLWKNRDALQGKKILDVGCHRGTFSYAALKLGASFVQGVDVEEGLVEQGRELLRDHGMGPKNFDLQSAEVLECLQSQPENAFDASLCLGLLYYASEPLRLLKELQRVTRETILLDTFTAAFAAIQGKDALEIYPHLSDEALDLPFLLVARTQSEKKDYRLPESFPYRSKRLSLTSYPTKALLELWFDSLELKRHSIDWSDYIQRPCGWRDLYPQENKMNSHWADIYSSGLRAAYRLSVPGGK